MYAENIFAGFLKDLDENKKKFVCIKRKSLSLFAKSNFLFTSSEYNISEKRIAKKSLIQSENVTVLFIGACRKLV